MHIYIYVYVYIMIVIGNHSCLECEPFFHEDRELPILDRDQIKFTTNTT